MGCLSSYFVSDSLNAFACHTHHARNNSLRIEEISYLAIDLDILYQLITSQGGKKFFEGGNSLCFFPKRQNFEAIFQRI